MLAVTGLGVMKSGNKLPHSKFVSLLDSRKFLECADSSALFNCLEQPNEANWRYGISSFTSRLANSRFIKQYPAVLKSPKIANYFF